MQKLSITSEGHNRTSNQPHGRAAALAMAAALGLGTALNAFASAPSDPVLDLLVKKGIITQDEAAKAQAEADQKHTNDMAQMPASKWLIGPGFKSIELFGDVRLRFENRSVIDPNGGSIALNRLRYALRFGLRGQAFDDFYWGFRLDTAANPRSPWVTFGTSTSGVPYQGPFGKSTAGLNVGQAFLGWHDGEWANVTIGKMAQPIYTTTMVWDSDFNPEGASEHFMYKAGDADIFATLGQFLYQDTNPTHSSAGFFGNGAGLDTSLAFMLAEQIGLKYHFNKDTTFQIAPVVYNYAGHGTTSGTPGFGNAFVGQGALVGAGGVPISGFSGYPNGANDGFTANQTGINDLFIVEVPWEVNFKLCDLNARVFGDFAQNVDGSARANAAFGGSHAAGVVPIATAQTHDVHAYQAGFAIGNKTLGLVYGAVTPKHAWELRTYWQRVEQYALDANLLDSDFFEGRGNLEGVYSAFAYGLTDNFIATLRYGHANRINDSIGTGGSNQDLPQMNPIQHYQLFQLDFGLRF